MTLAVLKETSGLKAKDIALRINQKFNETVSKKEINRILYSELKGQVIYNSEYVWTLVNGVKKNGNLKVYVKDNIEKKVQEIKKPTSSVPIITNIQKTENQKIKDEGLRQYQIEGRIKIFNSWRNGKRSVLFQMPTGTGKTVLFSEIVRRGFVEKRKILIVVHRKEIIKQITAKLREMGIKVGHILAGTDSDYSQTIQVASIQTLNRRKHPEADLIIIDECHHAVSKTYKELWQIYPIKTKFLGVTATPIRLNGEGFEKLFDELIVSWQIQKFIKEKYLVPIIHYVSSLPDLSSVKISKGDYDIETLSSVMMENNLMYDIVKSYENTCKGKSAIVFAVDVEHSKEIAYRYNCAGIRARHIDAKTPQIEREQTLNEFKQGKIKVISNVGIITEGFDFPECEVVQLARPTQSLSLYLQMAGRVMRIAPNKKAGIILDNSGLWREHGLTDRDRQWSLKGTKKKNKYEFNEIGEAIIDKDGIIRDINRMPIEEVKGMKLESLSYEIRRLLVFEDILHMVIEKNWQLAAAHYRYVKYLDERKEKISVGECDYLEMRLKYINEYVDPDKKLPQGFLESRKKALGL